MELLQSVPEDAFIARLSNEKLSNVRALGFVHWIGEYQPFHKLHESLAQLGEEEKRPIRLLLTGPSETSEVADFLRKLKRPSRIRDLKNGAVIEMTASASEVKNLSKSPAVLWIEPAPEFHLFDEVADRICEGPNGGHRTQVQALGFTGEGVSVAVADSGLNNGNAATMHPDLTGRVDKFLYYGTLTDAADENGHGTHFRGFVAANGATGEADENGFLYGLGMAPQAHIVVQRVFDAVGIFEAPPSNETLTRDAVQAGAIIGSNSWGSDSEGRYDISAMEFDALVRDADAETDGDQPYIIEFSAGNRGPTPQTVGSPAVAKNVIATGASENDRAYLDSEETGIDTIWQSSSRGPAQDGRIKPDLVAPGTYIASCRSASSPPMDDFAWKSISDRYVYIGGTSQAGAHVSGGAAVFVQYYREVHGGKTPSPALVKAALINSAADMVDTNGNTGPVPNNDEGWGRLDIAALLNGQRKFEYVEQTNLLATGETFEKRFMVVSSAMPLKVTLAYTDVPAFPGAIPALVNDLDLEVISPSGIVYHGNRFLNGVSIPNATAGDSVNNVEGVHLATPETGEYILRVKGVNIPKDARRDTEKIDQDFALVFSGDLTTPGVGVVAFDRSRYTAPGRIQVNLIDTDLSGKSSTSVVFSNLTHPQKISLTLHASDSPGVFTGSVATAAPPWNSAGMRLTHGDFLEVVYQDLSPAHTSIATAIADLVPPTIRNISASNRLTTETIRWTTDEPASSILICTTNGGIFGTFTNSVLTTDHAITIRQLSPNITYQYYVLSVDEAGNTSTDNNGGRFYSFQPAGTPSVLLVNNYISNTASEDIPVTVYTDALDQTGASYEVWDEAENGSPGLNILKKYRVVIWRINDNAYYGTGLSPEEMDMIQQYLNGGGAFLMSSMEILSRIGETPFRTNVLHVTGFTSNAVDNFSTPDRDHTVPSIQGLPFDSLAPGINVTLDYSAYPYRGETIDPDVSDTFTPATNAVPFLFEPVSGRCVGMRFPRTGDDSQGRIVFLSFPIDAVPMEGDPRSSRAGLLQGILEFLAPGLNGYCQYRSEQRCIYRAIQVGDRSRRS